MGQNTAPQTTPNHSGHIRQHAIKQPTPPGRANQPDTLTTTFVLPRILIRSNP